MRHAILVLGFILLGFILLGCGPSPPIIRYPINRPVSVDVQGQPAWVLAAVADASAFWALRGVSFPIADGPGEIPVRLGEVDEYLWATYHGAEGSIEVPDYLEGALNPVCPIVHELGHAVGLEHVSKAGDLMSQFSSLADGLVCPWTWRDAYELCRAGGPCPGAP